MGLFSSKKKHFVDASVVRVVEDEALPNTLRESIAESVFTGTPTTGTIIENLLNGNWINFQRAQDYAEDEYTFGTPDEIIYNSEIPPEYIRPFLESDVGEVESVIYAVYKPLNNFFMAWKYLYEEGGYDDQTNTLAAPWVERPDDVPVYLDKIVAYHDAAPEQQPEANALGSLETRFSKTGTLGDAASEVRTNIQDFDPREEVIVLQGETEGFSLHTVWEQGSEDDVEVVENEEFFSLEDQYDEDQEYYQVKYTKIVDGVRTFGFWVYDPKSGEFPELDNRYNTPDTIENGEFFPFIVFRQEGQNRASGQYKNTEQYRTTTELCKRIGFDYQEMSDQIHNEENEGIDDVRQAVMTLAVPLATEDEVQIEYLMDYFTELIEKIGYQPTSGIEEYANNNLGPSVLYATEWTDADFSLRMSFDSIKKSYRFGDIGDVGSATNTEAVLDLGQDLFNTGIDIQQGPGVSVNNKERILRRQLYNGVIEEIRIVNPRFRFEVFEDKGVEGGIDDDRLLIPVNMRIAENMGLVDREYFYSASLHLIFTSHVVETVKWYQRGIFKAILVIIAVVLVLYDGGMTLSAVISGLAAGGTAALAVTIIVLSAVVKVLLISKLISLGFKKLVEVVGTDVAIALAVIAVAYGAYGTFTDAKMLFDISPMELLNVASNLVENAIALEFEDLVSAYEDFQEYKDEKLELLESMEDLLDDPLNIDPLLFVYRQPMFVPGEGPGAFYNRTVDNKNPGATSIDFIQNFYDISLTLPEISD